MFEVYKFKKKYPLLTQFITDKKQIKRFLEDKELSVFYHKQNKLLEQFINNLKQIYSDELVKTIIMNYINKKDFSKLENNSYNLLQCINWTKSYNDNLDPIKDISWSIIENDGIKFNGYNIEKIILELCFLYNSKKTAYINNHDINNIFIQTESLITKRKLLSLLKNNNLEFFVFILKELSKYNINIENIDNIFKEEIDDNLYNPEIKEHLNETDFLKLIIYYFDYASNKDKKIISKILEAKNYELISDILHIKGNYIFSRNVLETEVNKDIFSLKNIEPYQILNIIYNKLSPKEKLDEDYLSNLYRSINQEAYDNFYKNHHEILDLLNKLEYKKFEKLTKEEQIKIYRYIKSLSIEQKNKLIEEIKLINKELRELYKNEFVEVISSSNSILAKAKVEKIKDSTSKEYNIKIYELKDEEPFTFLITVMHNQARDTFLNMYNRPAHKLTINDPSNFCKDLEGGSEIISTSMINDKFIDTFVGPNADVMYIFSDINANDILSICHEDAAFSPKINDQIDLFSKNNPVGPKELMIETIHNGEYNEIAISRKNIDNKRIMPTAILCYDKINDTSIKHAKYFNIPIIVINTKTYKNLKYYTKSERENNYHR